MKSSRGPLEGLHLEMALPGKILVQIPLGVFPRDDIGLLIIGEGQRLAVQVAADLFYGLQRHIGILNDSAVYAASGDLLHHRTLAVDAHQSHLSGQPPADQSLVAALGHEVILADDPMEIRVNIEAVIQDALSVEAGELPVIGAQETDVGS